MRILPLQVILYSLATIQMVQVGPSNPHFCDYFWDRPNLTLAHPANITGDVSDPTGAMMNNTPIELHRFENSSTQPKLRALNTDKHGHFVLHDVATGRYRLLFPTAKGFLQPEQLACPYKGNCTLNIRLKAASTDSAAIMCPVR